MSRCLRGLNQFEQSQAMAVRATLEWPWSREPWLELARAAYATKDSATCYWAAVKCLAITERAMTYTGDSSCWGAEPADYAALSAYALGLTQEAVKYGTAAVAADPTNTRLIENLGWYKPT